MIDRDRLATSHKAALRIYWMVAAVPVALAALGWWVASAADEGAAATAPAGVSTFTIVAVAVFGVAAVAGVPLLRARWRRRTAPQSPRPATALPGRLLSHMFIELALWEALAMIGFESAMSGEPVGVLFGTCLASFAGILFSYPRWSSWEDAADEADRLAGEGVAVQVG